jgi:hypothetical protein
VSDEADSEEHSPSEPLNQVVDGEQQNGFVEQSLSFVAGKSSALHVAFIDITISVDSKDEKQELDNVKHKIQHSVSCVVISQNFG